MKVTSRLVALLLSIFAFALLLFFTIFGSTLALKLSGNLDSPLISVVKVVGLLFIVGFVFFWAKKNKANKK